MSYNSPYNNTNFGATGMNPPTGGPVKPWNKPSANLNQQLKNKSSVRTGLTFAIGYVVIIWAVHLVTVLTGGFLNNFGIHPLDTSSLWGIFTSPFLHGSFSHLIGNTIPGFIFSFLIGMSGKRVFWEVTIIAGLIGGFGTWLFGGIGTNHIGASGLIYGWLGYLIVRGIFNRDIKQFLLGIVLAFIYSGLFWGLLPTQAGVSWQGHLFGALGGIGAGAFITSDDPAALKAKKKQKKLQK
ncbi:rhomboid family intramembrane serine protease [Corynebacterium crudilactis]|uniref:Rhomboid family intramembrane serine protease n=1 Tax=Corynebacterium crudilactis TaxID=1652495 RepID=A0A172QVI6_9CORY|nr:rhomboid family intramembrane serine protease [Corynebacterium crudilactis]ANE04724.1 rhomboid family intramembrane serine protease [Corynebacterium crudilactis]